MKICLTDVKNNDTPKKKMCGFNRLVRHYKRTKKEILQCKKQQNSYL